jgi:hypothetical protein
MSLGLCCVSGVRESEDGISNHVKGQHYSNLPFSEKGVKLSASLMWRKTYLDVPKWIYKHFNSFFCLTEMSKATISATYLPKIITALKKDIFI